MEKCSCSRVLGPHQPGWKPPAEWREVVDWKANSTENTTRLTQNILSGDFLKFLFFTWISFSVFYYFWFRFLEEYNKHNINFWGLTIQNEPGSGAQIDYGWQTLFLSPTMQRDFAYQLLSPALKASEVGKGIKLMAHDDQRDILLDAAKEVGFTIKTHLK